MSIEGYTISPYRKVFTEKRELVKIFYSLLSAYHDLELTDRELNLLSHITIYGGIASETSKRTYAAAHNTTIGSIDNVISRLKKKKMLKRVDGKTRIHPAMNIDFNNNDKFIFSFKCIEAQRSR